MPALTLDGAKAQLNITSTSHDAELADYVAAVNEVIESYVGPVDDRTVVERWTGGRRTIAVRHRPVVSVTSVTYLDDGADAAAVSDIDLDTELGVLRLKTAEWWPSGRLRVEYVAGQGGEAPAAADIAARIIVQHLWETQRGGDSRRPDLAGGLEVPASGGGFTFSVPRRAIQLLEAHATGPAVA